MYKQLKEISWNVTEPEYRADPALSYSTLARYEREGRFNALASLDARIETPSLTFGSAVDALITGGQKEFDEQFIVVEFPAISDTLVTIARTLFNRFGDKCASISEIPENAIAAVGLECGYYTGKNYEAYRVKKILESCSQYYQLLYIAGDKKILDTQTAADVYAAEKALRESEATRNYFEKDLPFNKDIEHCYQLKFKDEIEEVPLRCMADLIIVDHKNKVVYPCDLKTSGHYEYEFYESFVKWRYDIQARLYWRLIRMAMDNDDYFRDFTLMDYRFIVVNRRNRFPLVWECPFTQKIGTLFFGKSSQIVMRDPIEIAIELYTYLKTRPPVPDGINTTEPNNLERWLYTIG